MIIFTVGCTTKTDKELFDEANKLLSEEKYSEGLNVYEQLIVEFPNSDFMPKTLFEVGKLYHGQVINTVSPKESLLKAVDYYKQVYEYDATKPEAPSALFMAAFLYANELNDLESAKTTYELFLEKYPENELAVSAKAELENLGKPPEIILHDKIQDTEE